MKVLLLTRYGSVGASSRYRTYQYIPYLKAEGIDVTVSPLLSNRYLEQLYNKGVVSATEVIQGYISRLSQLLHARHFDLIWIEKEALPWLPAKLERVLLARPYIVDYDDALFHRYDQHTNPLVRRVLGHKINQVMQNAHVVVAGNPYIADKAQRAGAARIEVIPTVLDTDRYAARLPSEGFTVGWIGSPSTTPYLELVRPALREFCQRSGARFVAVGSAKLQWQELPVSVIPWSESTEVQHIQTFDVGIMPLQDSPWEQGKCGLKLLQYMACSLPVVGSPVGVNADIIVDGHNGWQAGNTDQWIAALDALYRDAPLRRTMGEAGRRLVESQFRLSETAPRLAALMRSVV